MIRALLSVYFDRVLISGNGWGIHFGHAPSEPAEIEKLTKPNPLDDKAFFLQVTRIAMEAADGVREAIAKDWGHSPMQPDKVAAQASFIRRRFSRMVLHALRYPLIRSLAHSAKEWCLQTHHCRLVRHCPPDKRATFSTFADQAL